MEPGRANLELSDKTILVVEDEFFIAQDLREEIEGAGGRVIGPCPNVDAALRQLDIQTPDCAMIDINLGEGMSFALPHLLTDRHVPFVFLTGYDAAMIPEPFGKTPYIAKPPHRHAVIAALRDLCRPEPI
ncbi:response regulator [Novosphingobium kaempferiae]|uniref:response regulator n=1 Tax=Novosphingobium kaempferiae TaxID=2896849 RepID=UPI0014758C61